MFQFTTIFLLLLLLNLCNINEARVMNNERENIQENDDYAKFEDVVPIHESYRPKHKYKTGVGPKRSPRSSNNAKHADDAQCAVLYKNNQPVGILQPYEDAYRFFPIKKESTLVEIQPLDIKSQSDIRDKDQSTATIHKNSKHKKRSNTATFLDENYPSVFTKFQLNNHLKRTRLQDYTQKKPLLKRYSAKDTSIFMNDNVNHTVVERGLQTVLEDMGLISDNSNEAEKRDAIENAEDENLELGTNKINLIKESKTENRGRRQIDSLSTTSILLNETDISNSATDKVYVQNTKLFKRSGQDDVNCINSNIKVTEYEKRVEREIRDKIKTLKDEVIKEIDTIKKKEEEAKRQKRQIATTLLDEETSDIDPNIHNEDSNIIHVRKKRSVLTYEGPTVQDSVKTKASQTKEDFIRRKRDLVEFQYNDEEELDENDHSNIAEQAGDKSGFSSDAFNKDGCLCDRNTKYCECPNYSNKLSNINVEHKNNNEQDNESKTLEKKSMLQERSCDNNANNYRDDNSNHNVEYSDSNDEDETYADKKSISSSCTCDKDGQNCKCYDENSNLVYNNNDDKKLISSSCTCDKNGKNCKCYSENSNLVYNNNDDKKSISSSCTCDKNGKNCKCYNENSNLVYNDNDNFDKTKYLVKKSVKNHCSCDKYGKNCKCDNDFLNTIPSIKDEYEGYYDYKESLNEQNNNFNYQELNNFSSDDNPVESDYDNFENIEKRAIKPRKYVNDKSFQNGEYLVDLEPEMYKLETIDKSRSKRDNLNDLLSSDENDAARRQLIAIRQRSMIPRARSRRRTFKKANNEKQRELVNMSHEDLFGALPQSFDGELYRYKRVRRSKKKK